MHSDKFPKILYRGDGTELYFMSQWYPEHKQWWVGYFDDEKQAWVQKVTAKSADQRHAENDLATLLQSEDNKLIYFIEKPLLDTGYKYDKSVVE